LGGWVLVRLLLAPATWLRGRMPGGSGRLLRHTLRHQWYVVPAGLALAATALVFVYGLNVPLGEPFATWAGRKQLAVKPVGRELVPSEDQNRFVVNVICPVGSSIDYVDEMLKKGEDALAGLRDPKTGRDVIASFFAAVAAPPGPAIGEGVLFARPVPADERSWTQTEVINETRKRLTGIPGMRAVALDLSTQGFTPTRGYPVDFAVQGPDWETVTRLSERIKEQMIDSGVVADVNSDYRPGMPEVHLLPDRTKA